MSAVVCNLCDCSSKNISEADQCVQQVLKEYPYAEFFSMREQNSAKSVPGTIEIAGKYERQLVINIFCKYYSGEQYQLVDNPIKREKWLYDGLKKLVKKDFKCFRFPADLPCYYLKAIDLFCRKYYLENGTNAIIEDYNKNKIEVSKTIDSIKPIATVLYPNEARSFSITKSISFDLLRIRASKGDSQLAVHKVHKELDQQDQQKNTDKKTEKNTNKTDKKTYKKTEEKTDKKTDKKIDKKIEKDTEKKTEKNTDENTEKKTKTNLVSKNTEQTSDNADKIHKTNKLSLQYSLQYALDNGGSDWNEFFNDSKLSKLLDTVNSKLEKEFGKILPSPPNLIFNAFRLCNMRKLKVVILGQDPYFSNPKEAMGLSFSVPEGVKIPPSLNNIFKEIKNNYPDKEIPKNGDLTRWAVQGVLLLNTALTVREKGKESHLEIWKDYTDQIIKQLCKAKKDPIVFLLWGNHAKTKKKFISSKDIILEAGHPSPLNQAQKFIGCQHFINANNKLEEIGHDPIDW